MWQSSHMVFQNLTWSKYGISTEFCCCWSDRPYRKKIWTILFICINNDFRKGSTCSQNLLMNCRSGPLSPITLDTTTWKCRIRHTMSARIRKRNQESSIRAAIMEIRSYHWGNCFLTPTISNSTLECFC